MTQYVCAFQDGDGAARTLLGGKGAALCGVTRLALAVRPGFVISTEACGAFLSGDQWPAGLEEQVDRAVAKLEQTTGKRFGDTNNPLLVSVRSGAAVSMPGMMDTVLNLGLNRGTT